jgi:cell division protein ZapD
LSIRSRVPGSLVAPVNSDLPAYYAWQHKAALRQADLQRYRTAGPRFRACAVAAETLVHRKGYGCGWYYQQTPAAGAYFQLLRMRIDPALGLSPEISGNRLMVSVPDASRQR